MPSRSLRPPHSRAPPLHGTGEGSPDLLTVLIRLAQDQMFARLCYSDELECTVLEVKKIEGLGTTVDVCLVNGELKDSDTLVLATASGPLITPVRTLLTPGDMKEMRVKNEYTRHRAIKGTMGVKITCADELDQVVAGTSVYVKPEKASPEELEELKRAVMVRGWWVRPRGEIEAAAALTPLCRRTWRT